MERQVEIYLLPPYLHDSAVNVSVAVGGCNRGLSDLRDVGSCRDGEGVSIESEGDIRHALDILAVHCSL